MQDASIQESMGPIQDRTKEHLCATDSGIIMTRKILLRAAKAAAEGGAVPATEPEAQRVRSASIELDKNVPFTEGARHGLYAAIGTDPLSV
jgi:phthalate 4,5-dioxygenase oxygenase subunit